MTTDTWTLPSISRFPNPYTRPELTIVLGDAEQFRRERDADQSRRERDADQLRRERDTDQLRRERDDRRHDHPAAQRSDSRRRHFEPPGQASRRYDYEPVSPERWQSRPLAARSRSRSHGDRRRVSPIRRQPSPSPRRRHERHNSDVRWAVDFSSESQPSSRGDRRAGRESNDNRRDSVVDDDEKLREAVGAYADALLRVTEAETRMRVEFVRAGERRRGNRNE